MNTSKIRLIAMDMDGTLLNGEGLVSKETAEALQEASQRGIAIAICSGRISGDLSLFALDNGLDNCHILSMNGAYCLESPGGKPYARHVLEAETLDQCVEVLDRFQITYACFQENRIIVMESGTGVQKKYWATYRQGPGAPEYRYGHGALDALKGSGVCKVVCVETPGHEANLEAIRANLQHIKGVDITASFGNNLEIMPEGINKGKALKELTEKLGLSPENVMAFGDYLNDLTMLSYAGCSVAMGNGVEQVKQVARYVTGTNTENGIAQAIYKYVL